jgi:putative transcriptional regulator
VSDAFPSPDSSIQLQGQLLISGPSLRGGTFDRSVVLIAKHAPTQGAMGLILNHPTGKLVEDMLTSDEFAPLKKLAVHDGGPLSPDQLTFSSFWWTKKGLRWALSLSTEQAFVHTHKPGHIVRAFVGYSGWIPGQLENELLGNSWIPTQPQSNLLGREHDLALWSELLKTISPLHRILAEAPRDPFLN